MQQDITTRDYLAIERTNLANERTFLAYTRTAIVLFASAIGILKIDFFNQIQDLGFFLGSLSPIFLVIGIIRYLQVKKKIKKMY